MNKLLFLIISSLIMISPIFAEYKGIIPVDIVSTSYLGQNDFSVKANYHPYYVIDDNKDTAWVEGATGDGLGEKIVLNYLDQLKVETLHLSIRNGYQKSYELFQKNNRLKEIKVNFINEINSYSVKSFNFTLEDTLGFQVITIDQPLVFSKVEIIIVSVYKGSLYQDTCLSDLRVEGNGYEKEFLKKQVNLKSEYEKWFKERNNQAYFFANLPKDYPFNKYTKTVHEKKAKFSIEHNWTAFSSIFKEIDVLQRLPKGYFLEIDRMLSTKVESESKVIVKEIKSDTFQPSLLNDLNINLAKFLRLSNIKISKIAKPINDSYTYKVSSLSNKVKKLTTILDYGERNQINYYYYDNSGKLIYVDIDKDYEEGEFFNGACLIWQQNKIIKIIHLYAIEGTSERHLRLTVYN